MTAINIANENEKFFENENGVYFKSGYPSQWYESEFNIGGKKFENCEQWMMYMKAITFNDIEIAEKVMKTTDPKEIKALGREVKNFEVNAWNAVADDVVFRGNVAKFSQNQELKELLLATGDKKFVECATYDPIWGIGMDITTALRTPEEEWKGTNRLGKAIMNAREYIRGF